MVFRSNYACSVCLSLYSCSALVPSRILLVAASASPRYHLPSPASMSDATIHLSSPSSTVYSRLFSSCKHLLLRDALRFRSRNVSSRGLNQTNPFRRRPFLLRYCRRNQSTRQYTLVPKFCAPAFDGRTTRLRAHTESPNMPALRVLTCFSAFTFTEGNGCLVDTVLTQVYHRATALRVGSALNSPEETLSIPHQQPP